MIIFNDFFAISQHTLTHVVTFITHSEMLTDLGLIFTSNENTYKYNIRNRSKSNYFIIQIQMGDF